ncbi:WD40 repeat domain-containing protein [Marinobacter sp. 1_MG-2023]|uniref:WD40 repeat domain-containing protein n=1 Tax=Marinobacter sp. 1_MG-2023 TaxID=3062627 RepID=UPI0026E27EC6|nr:WD40 repeat domain-containing protein [Marinobacter sp. 1_MG-2023]MDO6825541.1 WD40 repeat domain-containing protein [Marinobacter sp. 1_MG-2023]
MSGRMPGMKTRMLWIWITLLLTSTAQAQMEFPSSSQDDWRLEADSGALSPNTPRKLRTPVLIMGEGRERASEAVVILVDAPFSVVSPVVVKVWEQLGYPVEEAALQRADLPEDWVQLMLAAQPGLRAAMVNKVYGPELEQAVEDGALTDNERDRRLQLLGASIQAYSETMRKVPEFREPVQRVRHYREQPYGKNYRTDDYDILDLEPVMGLPVTAVTIQRKHALENRKRFLALADTPQFTTQNLVPAETFQATLDAITKALPDSAIRLEESPGVWISPVPIPDTLPAVDWRFPSTNGQLIEPLAHRLGNSQALMLRAVQQQPDGALILVAEASAERDGEELWISALLRLTPEATAIEVLWEGEAGVNELYASLDGEQLWFTGYPFGEQLTLFHYRQGEGVVSLDFPEGEQPRLDTIQWWVDGRGPVLASFKVGDFRRLDGLTMSSPQPVPRSDWFVNHQRLLKGGSNPWVEDDQGVAELDPDTGQVLRSFAVPPRIAMPEGLPSWPELDPRAFKTGSGGLVSAKGEWLATVFDIERPESDPMVGVHLMDTDKGSLLYSAVLPDASGVRLIAASPDGRWLALYGYSGKLVLWDVRAGTNPFRLHMPRVSLEDMTFSLASDSLIGVGDEHVLVWNLAEP